MPAKPATLKSMQKSTKDSSNRTRVRRAAKPQNAVVISSNSLGGAAPPKSIGEVRKILSDAFDGIGGQPAFERWARRNPNKFYEMWSRMLPRQSNVDVTVTSLEELLAKVAAQDAKQGQIEGDYTDVVPDDDVTSTEQDDASTAPRRARGTG